MNQIMDKENDIEIAPIVETNKKKEEKKKKKKVEETIVIRSNKMVYAVRLGSKIEGNRGRDNNPYIIVEDGKIKFIDRIYDSKSEFQFNNDVHVVAKEIFISGLRTAIKERILELKQLELVLSELGLSEAVGDSIKDSFAFLQKTTKYIGGAEHE